jgi:hypothetical protein
MLPIGNYWWQVGRFENVPPPNKSVRFRVEQSIVLVDLSDNMICPVLEVFQSFQGFEDWINVHSTL